MKPLAQFYLRFTACRMFSDLPPDPLVPFITKIFGKIEGVPFENQFFRPMNRRARVVNKPPVSPVMVSQKKTYTSHTPLSHPHTPLLSHLTSPLSPLLSHTVNTGELSPGRGGFPGWRDVAAGDRKQPRGPATDRTCRGEAAAAQAGDTRAARTQAEGSGCAHART